MIVSGTALEETLPGYSGNGMIYSFDTVGLQIQNSSELTLDKQAVAGEFSASFDFGTESANPS
jgi:hypothetical protein